MEVYRGFLGSRVAVYRYPWAPKSEKPTPLPEECYPPKEEAAPCPVFDHIGVHLSNIRVWTYTTGLPEISKFDVGPLSIGNGGTGSVDLRIRDRGVCSVAFDPIYWVEAKRIRCLAKEPTRLVGTLRHTVVGEVGNASGQDYSKEDYLRELREGQNERMAARKELEQARCEGNMRKVLELEAQFPDYPSLVGTEYTDGFVLSGDPKMEETIPRMPLDFLGHGPDYPFVDNMERRYWIGRVYIANTRKYRVDRSFGMQVAQAIANAYGYLDEKDVRRCSKIALANNCSYGHIRGSKSKWIRQRFQDDEDLQGDWELVLHPFQNIPWKTADGERPCVQWIRIGKWDRDKLRARQRLSKR